MPSVRTFYTLIITQIISLIGSRMTGVALGIKIFADTGDAAPLLIADFFAELPGMLGNSISGWVADRLDRKRVIMLGDFGQAAATGFLLLMFLSGNFQLWHLYLMMFVQGVFSTLQGSASQAAITMLVPESQRDRANGIRGVGFPLAGIIAPVLAGVLYTLVVAGTTGESPTLSDLEKLALFKTVVDAVAEKKTKVVAGTGTYDTRHSVEMTEQAGELGVDGVLAVTPYYSKPEQAGLIAHFEAIAAVGVPVMLYNIPGRTGRLIEVDTLGHLAEHSNIVAVKDAVENLDFTSRTVNQIPGFPVYSGQDSLTLPMMSVGAVGVVSVVAHLAGPSIAALTKGVAAGDYEEARRLHHLLLPLCHACFLETNPGPVKGALSMAWESVGGLRLPLTEASPATLQAVEKALSAIGGK